MKMSSLDWNLIANDLDTLGWSILTGLLDPSQCDDLAALYQPAIGFRSHVVMGRHGFGRGEYRYFAYPLSPLVQELRTTLYPHLAPIANRWQARMGLESHYPEEHAEYLVRCHAAGQARRPPLLLKYGEGDYNCLHQDLYGAARLPAPGRHFALDAGRDFDGGGVRSD